MERFDSCFHPYHACDPHPNEYHENIHYIHSDEDHMHAKDESKNQIFPYKYIFYYSKISKSFTMKCI